MSAIPKGRVDRLAYYETRVDGWVAQADAMGVGADLVASLQSKTIEARQAFLAQQQAKSAAQSATAEFNRLVREVRQVGGSVISFIHAKASKQDAVIYALASVDPPRKKSPIGPPGEPTRFQFALSQIGTLALTWKCKNPRGSEGTTYMIHRRDGSSGRFQFIGFSGKKRFTDTTLPRGVASVTYQIQAVRSAAQGPTAQFNVTFGTGDTRIPQSPAGYKLSASQISRSKAA